MQTGHISTPFGGRSMTLGMLASQYDASEIDADASVDKWKLFRALCEARQMLGVSDRALAVLNALLSFYPGNLLSAANGLVVFPSNEQLALRAHGIAPATLRRHLAALVETGLLIRRDSPNGKRYVRRGGDGEVAQAFGFSIAPLISRAEEINVLAAEVVAERQFLRVTREKLTLCRRDVGKLIETAMEEGAPGDWASIHEHFRRLVTRIPRLPTAADIEPILEEMSMLRDEVVNLLETCLKTQKQSGNESRNEQHIQNSKSESNTELEPALEIKQADAEGAEQKLSLVPVTQDQRDNSSQPVESGGRQFTDLGGLKSFPLGLVLRACPEIAMYGPGGTISSWRDMLTAGVVVRSMLGVSASAYEEACQVMGPENAATVMACLLERSGQINSAGGYLRDLTRRAERGEFAIGPMLLALARSHGAEDRRSA
ncbi:MULTISPECIES: plasmid replication protein RepC [unclassified Rhizobium]|uniref:plasmid replication protein RepC n=1 Tax=unclassified Rhizobium TaxID=2613769 RepID=UPI001ADA04E4|nr:MULTISPECIES: plasmid replication protein RepC [unclassified Rhizobium]MBO9100677.1 replication initiation protein RepC [Rhizobium sp. L58/93]MBO9135962.1 replication initiation protein RepC [Rhizobium sp. B209b/85]MBO9171273.1 replication initiation protein RepC [Rhizobium sp. L245/93]MBO9187140.1 replication initiation protein RepC [Rhizobium sp. E27B/91]QXZ88108.1 replication initiation protein RepC [Rhizobium sp. K1/93]